jgi:hypothetical protein
MSFVFVGMYIKQSPKAAKNKNETWIIDIKTLINTIMKKNLFLFAMLASVVASAQTGITVTPVSATYTGTPTVQFRVSWANSSRNTTHNSKVWVFVDYRTITNNVPSGSWTRALISGTPTATSGTPSRETGNDNGFWLQGTSGSSGTYNTTVTVTLSNVPAKFNWCAYATDYPPNIASVNGGTYTLKGTQSFQINESPISGNKYSGNITSLTDPTGCPGCIAIRDFEITSTVSIPCCPNLTACAGYCRDLAADDAVCNGGYEIHYAGAQHRDLITCPTGWKLPDINLIATIIELAGRPCTDCHWTSTIANGGRYNYCHCGTYHCETVSKCCSNVVCYR